MFEGVRAGATQRLRADDDSKLVAVGIEHGEDTLTCAQRRVSRTEVDQAFNPYWGAIFREGTENSRFGEQVEDYACVYTSRVSNFLAYSPLRYFRSPRDHMPHELV